MSDIEIPELPLEAVQVAVASEEVADESGGCATYAFIGSGQGGGRIAEAFYKLGYKKTVCVNTAKQDLEHVSVPDEQKLLFDAGIQGAGKDMRAGEAAAEKGQQALYELMQRKFGKVDHIFVCVGAGGGSGGGSVLVLIDTALKFLTYMGVESPKQHVGVIMSLPTSGEVASPSVAENAQFMAEKLCEYAKEKMISPLVFVDNDKIQRMYPQLTVKDFWPTVNATVAGLFHVFNLIPTKSTAYMTFDAADYRSVMQCGGCMIMGVTSVKAWKDSNGISAAIKSNLDGTLLADGFDLKSASHAAAVVLGGDKLFAEVPGLMRSIEGGFDTLAVMTGNAMVHRGVYEDSKERLNVYTLVGGLEAPLKRLRSLAKFSAPAAEKVEKTEMPPAKFGNRLYNE